MNPVRQARDRGKIFGETLLKAVGHCEARQAPPIE
jgi:hypothetical protein